MGGVKRRSSLLRGMKRQLGPSCYTQPGHYTPKHRIKVHKQSIVRSGEQHVQNACLPHVAQITQHTCGIHMQPMWMNHSERLTHRSEGSKGSLVSVAAEFVSCGCHQPQRPAFHCVPHKPERYLNNTQHLLPLATPQCSMSIHCTHRHTNRESHIHTFAL